MITWSRTYQVAATPEQAFDVIGARVRENHPRWEREVVEIRPLTPGPVALGSRSVMVRKEWGKLREGTYEVVELEPGRRIAFSHPDAAMDFRLAFDLKATPIGTDLTVHVAAQPKGGLRLFVPVLHLALPRRSHRITSAMVRVIEEDAALTALARP